MAIDTAAQKQLRSSCLLSVLTAESYAYAIRM